MEKNYFFKENTRFIIAIAIIILGIILSSSCILYFIPFIVKLNNIGLNIFVVSTIIAIFCFLYILWENNGKYLLFHPFGLFLFIYWLSFNSIFLIETVVKIDITKTTEGLGLVEILFLSKNYEHALIFMFCCFLSYILGYLLFFNNRHFIKFSLSIWNKWFYLPEKIIESPQYLTILSKITIFLGIIIIFYFIMVMSIRWDSMMSGLKGSIQFQRDPFFFTDQIIILLQYPVLLLFTYLHFFKKKDFLLNNCIVIYTLFICFIGIITNSRSVIFFSVLIFYASYNLAIERFKKFNLKKTIVVISIIIISLGTFSYISSLGRKVELNPSRQMETIVESFATSDSSELMQKGLLSNFLIFFNLPILTQVIDIVPDKQNYRYGLTYIQTLPNLLPSVLGRTSEPVNKWFKNTIDPNSYQGYDFAADCEAYLNFGNIGFLVFFIIGILIAFVWMPIQKQQTFDKRKIFVYCFYIIFYEQIIMYIRSDTLRFLKTTIWATIAFIIIYLVSIKIYSKN